MAQKPQILLIARHLPDFCLAMLEEAFVLQHLTAPDLLEGRASGEAVAVLCTVDVRMDAAMIAALPPAVRFLATYSVGLDHIDQTAAAARGLTLLNTPGTLAPSVAEVALLLMLGAARRVRESAALITEDRWPGWRPDQLLGQSLEGRTLGIFGMGEIGLAIAERARPFGMKVVYHNRSPRDLPDARFIGDAAEFLSVCDVLVLTSPLTPQTRGFLGAAQIAALPKGAIVINVSRGEVVRDAALIAALRSGHLAAAGLDVFTGEPALDPAYRSLPNVFALPHIGSSTVQARRAMMAKLIDGIRAGA